MRQSVNLRMDVGTIPIRGLSPLGLLCFAAGVALCGCSSAPPRPAAPQAFVSPASTGNEIAMRAISLLGAPYEFGAVGPTRFDCSGLVRYIHAQLGIAVPRTAAEQYSAATPVSLTNLEPGDLLFFRIKGTRISHVAIY